MRTAQQQLEAALSPHLLRRNAGPTSAPQRREVTIATVCAGQASELLAMRRQLVATDPADRALQTLIAEAEAALLQVQFAAGHSPRSEGGMIMASSINPNPDALQLHRAHCIQQANICDREAYEADQRGEWPAATLLTSCAAGYRKEAIGASLALRTIHRVTQ